MNQTEPVKSSSSRPAAAIIHYGIDIITVLLTATLLVLPIEDGIFWPLAFIALVPLLLRTWKRAYRSIFILTFASFFIYEFYVLQWVSVYAQVWRFALSFMNAITPALIFVAAFWLIRRYHSHFYGTIFASLFVLLEYKQTLGFLGFPWPLLCHSQCFNLPLIQIASVTGCWGVTFLIVHINETLAHLISSGFKPRVLSLAITPVVLIVIAGLYGAITLAQELPPETASVTIVQGSDATNQMWTENFNREAIDEYTDLTINHLSPDPATEDLEGDYEGPQLVIWPETAISNAVQNPNMLNRIRALASRFDATFLVGCLTWEAADGSPYNLDTLYLPRTSYPEYNSLVAFLPDSTVIPLHSKVRVVPFGEVIPMKKLITGWFPGYYWGSEDISPGTGFHAVDTPAGKVGAVVCYESFFPQLARNAVNSGAEILVLGSNTSWYERTRASYQHATFDVYRAIENGTWFCRAATTGISSVIDPRGNILFETELFKGDAKSVGIGKRSGNTLYTRLGDWLPALSAIYIVLLILGSLLLKEQKA